MTLEFPNGNTWFNNINATLDPFANLKVTQPETLFENKQIFDNSPLFYDDQETSGAGTSSTYNLDQASTTISVSNATAGTRVRQSKTRPNYQAGKGQKIICTGVLGAPDAGITRRIGLFDEKNGVFFEQDGDTLYCVLRSSVTGSPVDTRIPQSSWKYDKLDGNGNSSVTFDPTKSQIFYIDFEWLGVGQIRFGFFYYGLPIIVHAIDNAQTIDTVYMSTPNLPVRYEISNDGTGGAADLVHICSTVISEGGLEQLGVIRGASRGDSLFSANNNADWYPLLSIRLKADYIGATVLPVNYNIVCQSGTNTFEGCLFMNPTVAGTDQASWVSLSNSAIEYDISRDNTNTLTGDLQGFFTLTPTSNSSRNIGGRELVNDLLIGNAIDGTPDELVLAVRRVNGGSETYYANMDWRELV